MKKSILMLFVAALALGASAGSVSSEMAIAAANAWAAKNGVFGAGRQAAGQVISERDPENDGIVLWHQVSMQGGGMLVIAPVTEIEPVVMALDNDPGELAQAHPLRALLTSDMRRRLKFLGQYVAVSTGGATLQSVAPAAAEISEEAKAWGEACNAKWAKLTGASLQEAAGVGVLDITVEACTVKGFEKGGALTHWNQGEYRGATLYNYYTPGNAVCGCVATACATLAQFYGTTNALELSNTCSYNGVKGTYSTKAGAIDWTILPENWGGEQAKSATLTDEQRELIGRVAYNAGVGHGMMWTDGESGAFTAEMADVLKKVFGFKNARSVSLGDDATQYEKIIYNQCRAGAPVAMGIDGHAVVACGYGLDADGVERVRVFMGWAGAGDGWYALPKIDTKATMNGGTYLSEVVRCAITMVSYADDDVVPIVGHVSMPGASLEIAALNRVIDSNGYGYFGTRVPADMGTCEVTCLGKAAQIDIGAAAKDSDDAAELCADDGLPGAFEFVLLNSTVAYSLERAKLLAEKEGKAILRISGRSGETNTAAVTDYIYNLDKDNVDGFCDKFVYLFSSSSSAAGDGADISFGVYLPREMNPADRWQPQNGSLAYGYTTTRTWETNNTHSADHEVGEGSETSVLTVTIAPARVNEAITEVTNGVDDVEGILAAVIQSLETVLDVGATRYAECSSGIAVVVDTTDPTIPPVTNENCYVVGPHTFTCDAVVTNGNYVLGCSGWSLTNATTGATLSGKGTKAVLDLTTNDVVTLTWDLSKPVAVKVTVDWSDSEDINDPAAVTPGTGWYPYGEPVTFTAKEKTGKYGFNKWQGGESKPLSESAIPVAANKLLVTMTEPCSIYAYFRRGSTMMQLESTTISVTATSWFLNSSLKFDKGTAAPKTEVYGSEGKKLVASDGSADVVIVGNAFVRMGESTYVDAAGNKWLFLGYVQGEFTGAETGFEYYEASSLNVSESTAIHWLWVPDLSDPETEFEIVWDDALSTLNAHGYSTNLCTVAELNEHGISVTDIKVTAPKGFKAKIDTVDGSVVASLELDEEVLQPVAADGVSSPLTIVSNGDGTVTVKADVANGVRGFWYSLYATDELGGLWSLVASGYQAGDPSVQATEDDAAVSVSIDVAPTDAKKFYKLVVTDVNPSTID